MSEVNSEEEVEPHTKITEASPIKKGDFMTYSQLQKKFNSVIPDEETVSYNTSALLNSHLTYSMSQFERSNLGRIEEVSESQHSLFSQLQQSQHISEHESLKLENAKQKKQIEELMIAMEKLRICQKVEIDEMQEKIEEKDKTIDRLQQYEAYSKEQSKIIDLKDKQLRELKEQYDIRTTNLQQIIDDQTDSIKTLHKQINLSQNSSQIMSPAYYEKIRIKQTYIKQQFDELSKLYDEVGEAPSTPSKKQLLSRTPSRSNHSHQYNTEPKPLIM